MPKQATLSVVSYNSSHYDEEESIDDDIKTAPYIPNKQVSSSIPL